MHMIVAEYNSRTVTQYTTVQQQLVTTSHRDVHFTK